MPKCQTLSIRPVTERGPREALAGFSESLGTPKDTIRTKCKQGVIKAGAKRVPVGGSKSLRVSFYLFCSVFQYKNIMVIHVSCSKDV